MFSSFFNPASVAFSVCTLNFLSFSFFLLTSGYTSKAALMASCITSRSNNTRILYPGNVAVYVCTVAVTTPCKNNSSFCAKHLHNICRCKTGNFWLQYQLYFPNAFCKSLSIVTAPGVFVPASASYGSNSNILLLLLLVHPIPTTEFVLPVVL